MKKTVHHIQYETVELIQLGRHCAVSQNWRFSKQNFE